jgi:ribosomal protein S18 acetylase RimI-like enzyme
VAVSEWLLREATEADAATLVALIHGAFAEYQDWLTPPSGAHAETVEKVRDRMKTARAVLALVAGTPVGCVFYQPEETYLYFFRLAVLPTQRRRGLGQALIDYVEKQAHARHLPAVRLGVRIALTRQRAYYERLGYRPIESHSHPGFTEPTYLILEKRLAAGEHPAITPA